MDQLTTERVGCIEKQPDGAETFIPHKFFPDGPKIEMSLSMINLLAEATGALMELKGITETVPNPDLFVAFYVRKEALLSSQIEGTQCSLDDVIQVDEKTSEVKPVQEVVNYIKAMNTGLDILKDLPVSTRLMHEIHKVLLQGVRGRNKNPGSFKNKQNWIGPKGGGLSTAYFVPPPPTLVNELMGDWEKYYNEKKDMPVLIEAALLHSYFETIHPYIDGNGRLGRLLITFMLCERNILEKPLLYLSFFFKAHRREYYDLLMDVRFNGKWEEWIEFFLRGVKETSEEAKSTANEIKELQNKHIDQIAKAMGRSGAAMPVYNILCEMPINTISKIAKQLEVSYMTVKTVFLKFMELGIINTYEEKTRKTTYEYADYLNILRRGT